MTEKQKQKYQQKLSDARRLLDEAEACGGQFMVIAEEVKHGELYTTTVAAGRGDWFAKAIARFFGDNNMIDTLKWHIKNSF